MNRKTRDWTATKRAIEVLKEMEQEHCLTNNLSTL